MTSQRSAGVSARNYSSDDRQACLAVFDTNVPGSFTAAEREQFEAFLDELPGPYLVLEDESGRVTACGGYAIAPGSTTADLCWGMVARDHQGTGLGRMLVEIRVALCRRDSSVIDAALRTSQHTRAFYEKLGFTAGRVIPDGIAPGLDSCEMRMFIMRGQLPDNRPGES